MEIKSEEFGSVISNVDLNSILELDSSMIPYLLSNFKPDSNVINQH